MNGFSKPYNVEKNDKVGSILLYIRERIIFKSIPVSFNSNNLEYLLAEINLRKKKWILVCCYNPHKKILKDFLTTISEEIDSLLTRYENFLIIGDFNCQTKNQFQTFAIYDSKNLIKEPTCF